MNRSDGILVLFLMSVVAAAHAQPVRSERTISLALAHTVDTSRRKAYTSSSLRMNTTAILKLSQKNPASCW
jgi:uncharacterized protein GlcG (DUF336 family)